MNSLGKIFVRGLVTLLPIALTIYILYSAVTILDDLLGNILKTLLPNYVPGLGIIAIISLIFLFGLILNNFLVERVLSFFEKRIMNIPLIRTVYSPLKDLMNLFSRKENGNLQHVVFVRLGENVSSPQLMGLVTRENFKGLNLDTLTENRVAVYFPFSYGLGGYTLLVDRKQIQASELPVEKAMSLALTAWIKAEDKSK